MRANRRTLVHAISVIAASLLTVSVAQAATVPGSIYAFAPLKDTFKTKATSWSDPAFGDKGWTHSSDWGSFSATQGQVVTIIMETTTLGLHPGATVWYRGVEDTAPNNYVVDHFYNQNKDFIMLGATDEQTGAALGNIVMKRVIHGYDQDNNTAVNPALRGRTDGVPGKLVLSFKAPYTGSYMFVVGGFNPDATLTDLAPKYDVSVSVKFGLVPAPVPVP